MGLNPTATTVKMLLGAHKKGKTVSGISVTDINNCIVRSNLQRGKVKQKEKKSLSENSFKGKKWYLRDPPSDTEEKNRLD